MSLQIKCFWSTNNKYSSYLSIAWENFETFKIAKKLVRNIYISSANELLKDLRSLRYRNKNTRVHRFLKDTKK